MLWIIRTSNPGISLENTEYSKAFHPNLSHFKTSVNIEKILNNWYSKYIRCDSFVTFF